MDKLNISTGKVSLEIIDDNDESRGVFTFSPTDTSVANKVYAMQSKFAAKGAEFEAKVALLGDADLGEKLQLIDDVIVCFRQEIDEVFGSGSSQILFGDAKNIDMFANFFAGITPYYQKAAKARMAKHTAKYGSK